MQPCGVCSCWGTFWAHGTRGELVPKMVWRVKLVAELEFGFTTEVEVARLERDEQAGLADLGLRLAEAKQGVRHRTGRIARFVARSGNMTGVS